MREIELNRLPHDALLQLADYYEKQAVTFRQAAQSILETQTASQRRDKEIFEIQQHHLQIYASIEAYRAAGMTARESFNQARADTGMKLENIMSLHSHFTMLKRKKRMTTIEYLVEKGLEQSEIAKIIGIHPKSISRLFTKGLRPSRAQG
jgi:predicted XRE-type DNA-binding protein